MKGSTRSIPCPTLTPVAMGTRRHELLESEYLFDDHRHASAKGMTLVFDGAILLITGGTGSFGNAVLDRLLSTQIKEIRVFSRDEKKQDDMRHRYGISKLKFYIGDVRDRDSLRDAMTDVDFVFSAAALKQVPSCEFYPMEAVHTNVVGTDNTVSAAIESGVKVVVVLSTDKAAYPVNAMGMSKALMEKVAVARSKAAERRGTRLCVTRYGNVMASRGSVIPLFLQQLASGKPMTITDPRMTRFMMSLDAAVDLVLFAFKHGEAGDLFVQKAPAAELGTLAEAVMRAVGKRAEVQVIGTRHGEKLFETLLTREERLRAIDLGDYFRVPADTRDLNYEKYFSLGESGVSESEDYNSHNTRRLSIDEMATLLQTLECVQFAQRGERFET